MRFLKSKWTSIRKLIIACLMTVMAISALSSSAEAAAYTKGVYAPNDIGSELEGWADLSRDCSGTLGCYNYMKIERRRAWGWEYVNGQWANANGWNQIRTAQPYGCFNYRTTVDSYNDVAGPYGAGINIGQVGISSNGQKVYRYRTTWNSGTNWHCR